ncbi:MAG: GGDEF domain-containing protein [bacterium]|nr:GGDEF domain-containing protein [bacterium]
MDDIAKLRAVVDDLQARLKEEMRLREDLERRCNVLEKLVYRDPGTGLRTEGYMHTRVREEIERCIRYPASASLITLCAPTEKSEAVPSLGLRLGEELRESDQVFRLDQHGLAILLVETPEDGAGRVMERLGADLQAFIKGYGFTVTSFPVDANLAEDFMGLALTRHNQLHRRIHPDAADGASAATWVTAH